jgi:digeranylgeranylglycerophospholipid reductase
MDTFDVAVIGAGPAGSMAAKYAAKAGASTILLEEHPVAGWPVQCAGLLGREALAESELSAGSFIIAGMRGATVFSPGGARLDFKSRDRKAWVVDRRLFDRALVCQAVVEEVSFRPCTRVQKMKRDGERRILTLAGGEEISAGVVISAEGVSALVAHRAGIAPPQIVLSGAQVETAFAVEDPEKVEVHLGWGRGLFAWVIPIGEDRARIGLVTSDRACDRLRAFLKKDLIERRLRGSPVAINVGGLPMGPPAATAVAGLLAVGDAAAQVKPTSGGGIYPGLVAAKIAGGVAAAASMEGDSSARRLSEYDRLWRQAIGGELETGMRINRMMNKMSPAETDELISYLAARPRLIKTIEEQGDIDRPSKLMASMLPYLDWDAIRLARLLGYALE